MRAGISTASLFLRMENEEAMSFLDGAGVECAEVFLTSYYQYDVEFGKRLAQRKGKVAVNSVHDLTAQFEPQLFSRHEGVRRDSYQMLDRVLGVAKQLGAPYYTFHGTSRVKKASRLPENDDFESMRKHFQTLFSFCKERGVRLCLENVEWSTYNRPGVFTEIVKEVPELRGVLDIKQARISEYPYFAYLEEMGERLAYVHISDVTEKGKMCLPGQGCFDFDELIKRLIDVGFDGALLIEAYEKDYTELSELKAAYEYIREKISKYA